MFCGTHIDPSFIVYSAQVQKQSQVLTVEETLCVSLGASSQSTCWILEESKLEVVLHLSCRVPASAPESEKQIQGQLSNLKKLFYQTNKNK